MKSEVGGEIIKNFLMWDLTRVYWVSKQKYEFQKVTDWTTNNLHENFLDG